MLTIPYTTVYCPPMTLFVIIIALYSNVVNNEFKKDDLISQTALVLFCCSAVFCLAAALVKGRVAGIEVLRIKMILRDAEGIPKPLIMHDLTLPEELDGLADIGIVAEAEDVVVGDAGLLLGRQILMEISEDVPLDAHVFHVKGHPRGGDGVDPRGMIHKVGGEGGVLDLLLGQVAGELVEDGGDHFEVGQLLCTDVGQDPHHLLIGHTVPLMQVPHGGGQLPVRAAKL